jgi:hypothetical protein
LVENREWLRILIKHVLGESLMEIAEAGPLSNWNEAWLEGVEPGPELEAEAARKIEQWINNPGRKPATGPAWLVSGRLNR